LQQAEEVLDELLGDSLMHQPQAIGILVACALIVTAICVIYTLMHLSPVLVPLAFAIFLAFLVEPILSFIVFLPENIMNTCRGARRGVNRVQRKVSEKRRHHNRARDQAQAEDVEAATLSAEIASEESEEIEMTNQGCCSRVLLRTQQIWDVLSILLCVVVLLALIAAVVLGFYGTLDAFDWSKYSNSPKLKDMHQLMNRLGVNNTSWEDMAKHYQGEVTSVATGVIGGIGCIVLTLLLFFFCLVAILPGIRQRLPKSRMRSMMQRYLLCKTVTSLIIAMAVMLCLWLLDVELVLVFGIITFLLNFVPNVGSFFAIVAPVPLVFLTPGKDINDAIIVAVVPFIIHNSLGCILEPQLMQAGLDLHPLTVVVALTFWGAVWGAAGMVLSVPITCGMRLWLEEVDHYYARLMLDVLDKPLGVRTRSPRSRGIKSERSSPRSQAPSTVLTSPASKAASE